jgi:hypothetical protein
MIWELEARVEEEATRAAAAEQRLKQLVKEREEHIRSLAFFMKERWAHVPSWCDLIDEWCQSMSRNTNTEATPNNFIYSDSQRFEDKAVCYALIETLVPTHLMSWLDEREVMQKNTHVCRNVPTIPI